MVQAATAAAGVRVIAAGTGAPGRSAELARAFDAEPLTDLRNAIASTKPSLFLLAASDQFGEARPAEDADALRQATARGTAVATLEPLPASLLELATGAPGHDLESLRGTGNSAARWARFMPLSRASSALRDARDVIAQFGAIRSASIVCLGAPVHGTLGARVLDAMDLCLNLVGEPETVDASFTGAHAGQAVHTLPGETLRGLHGDLTAHIRFADGRACSILASNQAGRWERVLTLVGAGGRLRIYNDGFEWIGIGGEKLDQSRARRTPKQAFKPHSPRAAEVDAVGGFAAELGEQIATLLHAGPSDLSAGAIDLARTLAIGQTALLSARTGEGEGLGTILRMAAV